MDMQTLNGVLINYMVNHPFITLLVVLWIGIWKLTALWKAAKHNHLTMFIILGVVNTLGLLEIIYIIYVYFQDKKQVKNK